ncbi:MAG: PqqD family protein [Longimicrobiales bacterium]
MDSASGRYERVIGKVFANGPAMSVYKAERDVISTDLGHEIILLDPASGEMFSLNETGRSVWLALPASSVEQIAASLSARFDVTMDRARNDVRSLLHALEQAGLIQTQCENGAE